MIHEVLHHVITNLDACGSEGRVRCVRYKCDIVEYHVGCCAH
jgi:hypothetical protein